MAENSTVGLLPATIPGFGQQHSTEIKTLLDQRRHHIDIRIQRVVDRASFRDASQTLLRYMPELRSLDSAWQTAHNQNNWPGAWTTLTHLDNKIAALEGELVPMLRETELPMGVSTLVDGIANRLLASIAEKQAEFHATVKEGIAELRDLKRDVVLAKKFGTHIGGLQKWASIASAVYLGAALLCLGVIVAGEVWVTYVLQENPQLVTGWVGELMLRVAAGAPLAFLTYFLFHQHRVARVVQLKYQHLAGFLGGGARELIEILSGEDVAQADARRAMLKQIAEGFVSIDDVIGALNRSQTPIEDLAKLAQAIKNLREH